MHNLPASMMLELAPGVRTRFIDTEGDGLPIVLIHGLAASIEAWRDVIGPLSRTRRVLAFDLPGFGEADKPCDADYRALGFFVPMLHAFLERLAISKTDMVGSSMGASLIIRYAAQFPDSVNRAVLAAPGGFARYIHPFLRIPTIPLVGKMLGRPMRATNAIALALTVARKERRPRALLDEVDAFSRLPGAHNAFVKTLRGIATPFGLRDLEEFAADARAFDAPTLLLWGDRDRIFPVAQASRACDLLPRAKVFIMKNCGHFPQIDDPQVFSTLVERHLAG